MPLPKATIRTPEAIEDISVTLTDYIATDEPARQTAEYSVQVLYNDGSIKVMTGNLAPHLTTSRITALKSFMNEIRTKAEEEILP
jgi:dihydroxyacid dehydratase/phosphogluconate dehydratase